MNNLLNNNPFEWTFQTTATTFDPAIYKYTGGDTRWILSGQTIKDVTYQLVPNSYYEDVNFHVTYSIYCNNINDLNDMFFILSGDTGNMNGSFVIDTLIDMRDYGFPGQVEVHSGHEPGPGELFPLTGTLKIHRNWELKIGASPSYIFTGNTIKTIKTQLDNYNNIQILNLDNQNIVNNVNLSNFKKCIAYMLQNNNISNIYFPTTDVPISTLYLYNDSSIQNINLSGLTGLGGYILIRQNNNLNTLLFPQSSQQITEFLVDSNPSLTSLNLIGLTGLSGSVWLQGNTNMNLLTLPQTNKTISQFLCYSNPSLTSLDLSGLKVISGNIQISYNLNLTGLTLPNSTCAITYFDMSNNPSLISLNLSGFTKLGGNINLYQNTLMSSLTLPISNITTTDFYCYSNPLLTALDLSGMRCLGGIVDLNSNTNLTGLTLPISPCAITYFDAGNNIKLKNLSLTGLTGLGTDIRIVANSDLSGLTFPHTNQKINILYLNNCALSYVDFRPLSGVSQNGIYISIHGNPYNTVDKTNFNRMVVELDSTNWTGGTLYHTNALDHNTTDGGYNGTAAVTSLSGKSWTLLYNSE